MLYRHHIPAPPLAAFVSCLWYSEGLQGTHARERLLPNGESGIVFDLRENHPRHLSLGITGDDIEPATYAPAVYCGARTDSFLLDTSQQERVIGIQFHAGGSYPFLSVPASAAAGATYDLSDIWPRNSSLLREQLLAAPSINAQFTLLEEALLQLLLAGPALHPIIPFATRALKRNGVQVQAIVDQSGISARHFKQMFLEQTGITPKAFQRVSRFQKALRTLRTRPVDGGRLALDCGYFDQAHFIHDFKRFCGLTPTQYLAVATPHLNHLPLP